MSKRHRDEKPLRNPKEVRRLEHRALRHRVGQTLHEADDVDAVVLDEIRTERPRAKTAVTDKVRHWKLKSWKRRTALQAERNAALAAIIHAD